MIISSRKSPLALKQSELVRSLLEGKGIPSTIKAIQATGDIDHKLVGIHKDSFTKAIENQLLDKNASLAVHSLKDLSFQSPNKLCIAAFCGLEDRTDVLVRNRKLTENEKSNPLENFYPGMRIGTSSLRRSMQIKKFQSRVTIKPLRGNIHTRLTKLQSGEYDAIILASAGIARMQEDLSHWHSHMVALPLNKWLPAPGQGILAVQCRVDDQNLIDSLHQINDPVAERIARVERLFCSTIGADCHDPIACLYSQTTPSTHKFSATILNYNKKISSGSVEWQYEMTPDQSLAPADHKVIRKLIEKLQRETH